MWVDSVSLLCLPLLLSLLAPCPVLGADSRAAVRRELTSYALYSIPPIEVTFKSRAGEEFKAIASSDNGSTNGRVPVEGFEGNDGSQNPTAGTQEASGVAAILSSVEYPLRTISQRELLRYFQRQIDALLQDSMDNVTETSRELYSHLVALDFTVQSMEVVDAQRQLLDDSLTQNGNNHMRHRQEKSSDEPRRRLSNDVTIRTLMIGSLAFLEPHDHMNKPSSDEVFELFGGWMNVYFNTPATEQQYWRALTMSSYKVLQEIVNLDVVVDADPSSKDKRNADSGSSSWSDNAERIILIVLAIMVATTACLLAVKWYAKSQKYRYAMYYEEHYGDDVDSELGLEYGEATKTDWGNGSRYRQHAGAKGDPYYNRRTKYKNPGPLPDLSKPSLLRAGSLDAVRHGQYANYASSSQEALSILEASDRYLSKHRPEWLDIGEGLGVGSSHVPSSMNARSSAFATHAPGQLRHGPEHAGYFGAMIPSMMARTYNVLPSNPVEYIYQSFSSLSGSSHHRNTSESTAGTQNPPTDAKQGSMPSLRRPSLVSSGHTPKGRRRSSTIDSQGALGENIAALKLNSNIIEEDEDDDVEFHTDAPTPRSALRQEEQAGLGHSIWRNVSSLLNAAKEHTPTHTSHQPRQSNPEDSIYFNEDAPVYPQAQVDILEQLKSEEDSYDFAFADFPRLDGTPCLVYNPESAFRIGSSDEEDGKGSSEDDLKVRSPSTNQSQRESENDAFRTMLSEHSLKSSFDNGDDSIVDDSGWNDEDTVEDLAPTASSVKSNAKFSAKLNRIMANRHRQYEKKVIVEKHQQNRNARREKFRKEQEKRALERHQAMESALESLEATMCSPLDSTQYMKNSTGHRRVHSNASVSSQTHRRTESNSSVRSHRRIGSNISLINAPSTPRRRDWAQATADETGYSPRLAHHNSGLGVGKSVNASPLSRDQLTSYRISPKRAATRSPAPRSPMPRSPMVPHAVEIDAEAAAQSPVVQFSGGIFRPSPMSATGKPKLSSTLKPRPSSNAYAVFPNEDRVIRKSDSGRSVSPPGGIEGDDEGVNSSRPKHESGLPRKKLDHDLVLDMPKLSIPMSSTRGPNKVSPSSVMDDIAPPHGHSLKPRSAIVQRAPLTPGGRGAGAGRHSELVLSNDSQNHRRVYSFDHDMWLQNTKSFDTIDGKARVVGSQTAHIHRPPPAGSSQPRASTQQETARDIGRTNSFNGPGVSGRPLPTGSRAPTHRRRMSGGSSTQSKALSTADDLMLHGIYAKTR